MSKGWQRHPSHKQKNWREGQEDCREEARALLHSFPHFSLKGNQQRCLDNARIPQSVCCWATIGTSGLKGLIHQKVPLGCLLLVLCWNIHWTLELVNQMFTLVLVHSDERQRVLSWTTRSALMNPLGHYHCQTHRVGLWRGGRGVRFLSRYPIVWYI